MFQGRTAVHLCSGSRENWRDLKVVAPLPADQMRLRWSQALRWARPCRDVLLLYATAEAPLPAETPHAVLGLETGSAASISNGRRRLRRWSGRALTRHEPSGHRDARTQRPLPCSPQTYSTRVPPQNEAARGPSAGGPNGCHLSWGRKRVARLRPGVAGPVQEVSRRAMLRIVRVKGFQGCPVSLSRLCSVNLCSASNPITYQTGQASILRPRLRQTVAAGPPEKAGQHRPDAWLTRRGLPRRAHQPIGRRIRPKAFALPKPAIDHRKVLHHRAHLGAEFRRKLRLKADAGPHARGHRQDDVIKRSPVAP